MSRPRSSSLRTGGQREPRLDVVCLVNGIPLGCNREQGHRASRVSAAADDWRGYWHDAPQLVAQASRRRLLQRPAVSASGPRAYRTSAATWSGPTPGRYTARTPTTTCWSRSPERSPPTPSSTSRSTSCVFETREGVTTKKLARAHQYRAANKLVQRVVDGKFDRGIIWHATGSGKSLTMVFAAAQAHARRPGNPTVLLVIDRTELDEQINETLTACEFDGVQPGDKRTQLAELLGSQGAAGSSSRRSTSSTTQWRAPGGPSDVIAFVDEAHRTQFGDLASGCGRRCRTRCLFGVHRHANRARLRAPPASASAR